MVRRPTEQEYAELARSYEEQPPTTDEIRAAVDVVKRPDPDELLKHCHQALAMNNAGMLAVCFMTLDKHLKGGGALPSRWSPGNSGPIELTTAGEQPIEFKGREGDTIVLDAENNVTVTDKRGKR